MQCTCTGTSFNSPIAAQNCWKSCSVGVLEIDGNVDVRHAETADARGLVGQRLLVGMEPKIDDVADAEGADVGELRLGRLTGRGDPIIEPTPVVDAFRVSHEGLLVDVWGWE